MGTEIQNQTSEVIIIGAGVIGSGLAMHLALDGVSRVLVLDFDLEGTWSSSELNAGGVRATWNQPLNIDLSKKTLEYFESISEQVGFRQCGYLWLKSSEKWGIALKARSLQAQMGWPVEEWSLSDLRKKIPWLDKHEGIAGVLFSPRDGLINSNRVKNHYREIAQKKGVVFEDGIWVQSIRYDHPLGRKSYTLLAEKYRVPLGEDEKKETLSGHSKGLGESVEFYGKTVVNCAGPWASAVAKKLLYSSPCHSVRRQICLFDSREVDLNPYGMIVDTSGVYFHPESGYGLAGLALPEDPSFDFSYDGEGFFNERIWPALFERSSYFERLKHLRGWSGLYEVSPDESAVLGKVQVGEAGRFGQVYEMHSFSGHGVMQSYAAPKALAELIMNGKFQTIDASTLNGDRFVSGKLVSEGLVI